MPDRFTESTHEVGWSDKLIKDVAFSFDGTELPFHSAKESIREAGFTVESYDEGKYTDTIMVEAINRRWYYTQFSMAPHSEATFNVRYKVYANSGNGLISASYDFNLYPRAYENTEYSLIDTPFLYRYFTSAFTILYDFTPAKHFGSGRPYVIDVNIDLSNLDDTFTVLDGYCAYLTRLNYNCHMAAGEVKPIDLTFFHSRNKSRDEVERIIKPFVIPETEYVETEEGNCVTIEFTEPAFVSDIACDIDTAQVASIKSVVTFADGREKRYSYNKETHFQPMNCTPIASPVILTITDAHGDGMLWSPQDDDTQSRTLTNLTGDFDKDVFKIKTIRLCFERKPSASSLRPFANIRILDARFDKPAK